MFGGAGRGRACSVIRHDFGSRCFLPIAALRALSVSADTSAEVSADSLPSLSVARPQPGQGHDGRAAGDGRRRAGASLHVSEAEGACDVLGAGEEQGPSGCAKALGPRRRGGHRLAESVPPLQLLRRRPRVGGGWLLFRLWSLSPVSQSFLVSPFPMIYSGGEGV